MRQAASVCERPRIVKMATGTLTLGIQWVSATNNYMRRSRNSVAGPRAGAAVEFIAIVALALRRIGLSVRRDCVRYA